MKDFLGRSPFIFISMLGLLSFTKAIVTWQEDLRVMLDVYTTVSNFIWGFLFTWLENWLSFEMPAFGKDYFLMMIITGGAWYRSGGQPKELEPPGLLIELIWILLWPIFIVGVLIFVCQQVFFKEERDIAMQKHVMIFVESFIWAFIIIAINYALLFTS